MSQIAGRLSIQEGAKYIEKRFGGEGVLLAGVPGTPKANIVILGGGSVGTNACKIAVGMGANVTIMDINLQRLAYLDDIFGARIQTLVSNDANIEKAVKEADLVIGCVLIPGKSAPKIFKKKYLKEMKPGAVFVDVAVDQGGCGETTKVTYHDDPIFIEDGVDSLLCRHNAGSSSKNIYNRTYKCNIILWIADCRKGTGAGLQR